MMALVVCYKGIPVAVQACKENPAIIARTRDDLWKVHRGHILSAWKTLHPGESRDSETKLEDLTVTALRLDIPEDVIKVLRETVTEPFEVSR
jgi:hypothetical protein